MARRILRFIQRYLLGITLLVILLGLVAELAVGRIDIFSTSYYSRYYSTVPYSLGGQAVITQEFQAKYPGLNRVELFFKRSGVDSDARLLFQLKNSCEAESSLAINSVKFFDLPETGLYVFEFPAINDSRGREFCAVVSTQALDAPAEVHIYASAADVYWSGRAIYQPDNSPRPRQSIESKDSQTKYLVWLPLVQKFENTESVDDFDVGFRLYYDGPTQPTLLALIDHLAANKPFPLDTPSFYVFIGVIYVIGLLIFWRLVINLKSGPKF